VDYCSVEQALWVVEALDGSKAAAQATSDRIRPAAAELAQVTTKSQSTATPQQRARSQLAAKGIKQKP
jgi:hypothetical protein